MVNICRISCSPLPIPFFLAGTPRCAPAAAPIQPHLIPHPEFTSILIDLLSPAAAALELSVSEKTLTKWRQAGKGPPCVRLEHGRVRYSKEALHTWRASQSVTIHYSPLSGARTSTPTGGP